MKKKKSRSIMLIAIFVIISGILSILYSFPFNSVYTSSINKSTSQGEEKVYINNVLPNSPAEEAGIQSGDIILSIENQEMTKPSDVVDILSMYTGKETSMIIERNEEAFTVSLVPRSEQPMIGIEFSFEAQKVEMPVYKIIPYQILRSYMGYEEVYSTLGTKSPFSMMVAISEENRVVTRDYTYRRLRLLTFGILNIVIGFGLLKQRRWAYYSFIVVATISIVSTIYFVSMKRSAYLFYLLSLLIDIGLVVWLYALRKKFT